MAKGLFTQGMCVLLRQPMSIRDVESRLSMFDVTGRQQSIEDDAAPETLVLKFRPEVDGHLMVTPSRARWPDDMGEPDENPEAFVAWSLGQYGPLTYPGCLGRAIDLGKTGTELRRDAAAHVAHVRLLISYVLGVEDSQQSDEELPMMPDPDEYDAVAELQTLTRAVTALLEAPAAIAYFNPAAELLRSASELRRGLNLAWSRQQLPLDMWVQTRHMTSPAGTDEIGWEVVDTVGHGQLDMPDLEAAYFGPDYRRSDVEAFLDEITQDLVAMFVHDEVSGQDLYMEGETRDGPGGVSWSAMCCGDSLNAPPRPTIRWVPDDGRPTPPAVLADDDDEEEEDDEDLDWLEEQDLDFIDSDDLEDDELDEPF